MNKGVAESILGLDAPYDYSGLREAWRRLCADYHPDLSRKTGMDERMADEALRDINEAFEFLKAIAEARGVVVPESAGGSSRGQYAAGPHAGDWREAAYDGAVARLVDASSSDDYKAIAEAFHSLGDYRNSLRMAYECLSKANDLESTARKEAGRMTREEAYELAVRDMAKAESSEDYEALAAIFQAFGDYEHAESNMQTCLRQAAQCRLRERTKSKR